MVRHCMEAKWTSELRQDILTFDVLAALRVAPESADRSRHIYWAGTVLWLDLTFWVKQHVGQLTANVIRF